MVRLQLAVKLSTSDTEQEVIFVMEEGYEDYEFVESNEDCSSCSSSLEDENSNPPKLGQKEAEVRAVALPETSSEYSRQVQVKQRIYGEEYRVALPFEAVPECATDLRVEASCPSEACLLPQQQQPGKTQDSPKQVACYKRPKIGSTKESDSESEKTWSQQTSRRLLSSDGDVSLDHLCPTSRWYIQLPIREENVPPNCERCYGLICVCMQH